MDLQTFRYYTAWIEEANRQRYDTPADPWKLIEVNPAAITHRNETVRLNWGLGRVQGGNWDRQADTQPIRESTFYQSLEQHFREGRHWEQTAWFREIASLFEEGKQVRGYETLDAFRSTRCAYIDELYRRIDKEGYRPNKTATHEMASEDNPFEDAYANHLEPLVVIGRNGELYLTEGNHRFAIASILDIERLPVQVLCRHEQWQQIREQTAATGKVPEECPVSRTHPDLLALVG